MNYGLWPHLADEDKVGYERCGGMRNEDEDLMIAAIDVKRDMEAQQTGK